MDSIKVHVDSVIVKGWTISTNFHCNRDISFQYRLTFTDSMPARLDSLFQFVKNLKPGSDTTLNFSYMGEHDLNSPLNTSETVLKIYAFPTLPVLKRD